MVVLCRNNYIRVPANMMEVFMSARPKLIAHFEYQAWYKEFMKRNMAALQNSKPLRDRLQSRNKALQPEKSTTQEPEDSAKSKKKNWKFVREHFQNMIKKTEKSKPINQTPVPDPVHPTLVSEIILEIQASKKAFEEKYKILDEWLNAINKKDKQYEDIKGRTDLEKYRSWVQTFDSLAFRDTLVNYIRILFKQQKDFDHYLVDISPTDYKAGTDNSLYHREQTRIQVETEGLSVFCDALLSFQYIFSDIEKTILNPEPRASLKYLASETAPGDSIHSVISPSGQLSASPSVSKGSLRPCMKNSLTSLNLGQVSSPSSQPSSTDSERELSTLSTSSTSLQGTADLVVSPSFKRFSNQKNHSRSNSATPTGSKNVSFSEPYTPSMVVKTHGYSPSISLVESEEENDDNHGDIEDKPKTRRSKSLVGPRISLGGTED